MAVILNINGNDFFYPETNDVAWGPDATDWAVAVTSGMLQKAGGLFQLLGEVDFGANYGLKSIYFKSRTTNSASVGSLRLARTDVIAWRNQANDGDLFLEVNSSNQLVYNNGVISQPIQLAINPLNTNSIDLTLNGQDLTADLNLSSDTADAGFQLVSLSIESDGLKAQLSDSSIIAAIPTADTNTTGLLSDTDWNTFDSKQDAISFQNTDSIDLTFAAGDLEADLNLSSASPDSGNINAITSIETDGLQVQVPILVGDTGSGGTAGVAPAPAAGDASLNKYLKADGTWSIVSAGGSADFAFGGGTDGDATITGSILLTRDMYYNNLTISGAGSINTTGFRVFVKGTLDLTAASARAIGALVNNGQNATINTGIAGNGGDAYADATVGGSLAGAAGGSGAATAGAQGGTGGVNNPATGGISGVSGKGGNGSSGSGGAARGANPLIQPAGFCRFATDLLRGASLLKGGSPGPGGGGGSGNGTNQGGGGGGGGAAGGVVYIAAHTILTNGAAASSIWGCGGNGGNGFTPITTTNRGGGGGGAGAGGGFIYVLYAIKGDLAATDVIDASGGAGGAGGNGIGTGTGGDSGGGGAGGRICLFNISTGSGSETYGGTNVASNPASGGTGGASVPGQSLKVSF